MITYSEIKCKVRNSHMGLSGPVGVWLRLCGPIGAGLTFCGYIEVSESIGQTTVNRLKVNL